MSASLKSSRNPVFHLPRQGAEKNDLHRGPINDDLTLAYTLGYPLAGKSHHRQNNTLYQACLAWGRRSEP